MSFLVRVGESEDTDRKLALVRRKYFHNILEYNQHSQRHRQEQAALHRQQANLRIAQLNLSALEQLEEEEAVRRQEKLLQQETLREEYERQIRDRKERLAQEREGDKKYIRMQLVETEKASERRVADLLKIYDRAAVRATLGRVKTEPDQPTLPNPEPKQEQQLSKRTLLLPSIDRPHATSVLKSRPEGEIVVMNQSQRSLRGLSLK